MERLFPYCKTGTYKQSYIGIGLVSTNDKKVEE